MKKALKISVLAASAALLALLAWLGWLWYDANVDRSGWLTRDGEERARYASDPKCNFPFTAAGYRDMLTILKNISDEEWAKSVPLSLPVHIISGSEDPVGNYGAGPHDVADALIDAEVNEVDIKIFDGYRHELFFEVGRENVYADVVEFVDTVIEGVHEARMAQAFGGFHVPLTTMGDYDTPTSDGDK